MDAIIQLIFVTDSIILIAAAGKRGHYMEVGKRLQNIRKSKHISVYRISQDTGISTSHINSIERGEKNPSVETLCRLIEPLGITMSEFFNDDGDISYLNNTEKEVIEFFRTMPDNSAAAVIQLIRTIKRGD